MRDKIPLWKKIYTIAAVLLVIGMNVFAVMASVHHVLPPDTIKEAFVGVVIPNILVIAILVSIFSIVSRAKSGRKVKIHVAALCTCILLFGSLIVLGMNYKKQQEKATETIPCHCEQIDHIDPKAIDPYL